MPGSTPWAVARIAATVAVALFAVVILLQLLLAAGVLPVTMAWGGTQDTLTPGLRAASLGATVFLTLFALVIMRRAGLVGNPPITRSVKVLSWLVTGLLALNTLGNLASQSTAEAAVFAPITILLTVACGVVSISKPPKGEIPDS